MDSGLKWKKKPKSNFGTPCTWFCSLCILVTWKKPDNSLLVNSSKRGHRNLKQGNLLNLLKNTSPHWQNKSYTDNPSIEKTTYFMAVYFKFSYLLIKKNQCFLYLKTVTVFLSYLFVRELQNNYISYFVCSKVFSLSFKPLSLNLGLTKLHVN